MKALGKSRNGFSLVEVVIAIGILSMCLLLLIALLARGANHVGDLVDLDEMHRLITTVETTLQKNGLPTVYGWVQSGQKLRAYSYAVDPLQNVGTGTTAGPKPLPNAVASGTVGQDYVVMTGVRAENDPMLASDLQALVGKNYRVTLDVSPFNVGTYTSKSALPSDFTTYAETRLVLTVTLSSLANSAGSNFTFTTMVLR